MSGLIWCFGVWFGGLVSVCSWGVLMVFVRLLWWFDFCVESFFCFVLVLFFELISG